MTTEQAIEQVAEPTVESPSMAEVKREAKIQQVEQLARQIAVAAAANDIDRYVMYGMGLARLDVWWRSAVVLARYLLSRKARRELLEICGEAKVDTAPEPADAAVDSAGDSAGIPVSP